MMRLQGYDVDVEPGPTAACSSTGDLPPGDEQLSDGYGEPGVFSLDLASGRLRGSDRARALFGFPPGRAPSHVAIYLARLFPEDAQRLRRRVAQLDAGRGGYLRQRCRLRLPDGGTRPLLVQLSLCVTPQTGRASLAGVVLDTAPPAVPEPPQDTRLALAADLTGIGFWEWERNGVQCTAGLLQLFGLPDGTPPRLHQLLNMVHPDDQARVLAAFGHTFVMGCGDPVPVEFRLPQPDGGMRRLRSAWRPVRGADGEVQRVICAAQDVTALHAERQRVGEALAQRDLLMREVNHRVKNSLQLVASLLALEACTADQPAVRRSFDEACGRIVTVSRIHERLYRADRLDGVPLHDYLGGLLDDLGSSMGIDGRSRRLTMDLAGDVVLPPDSVIPLALTVNELVTNAVKHAFPEDRVGTVLVRARRQERDLQVDVSDDGVGLPGDFNLAEASSLGLRLVHALCRQLGAQLEVMPVTTGTCIRLSIPMG